MWVLERPAYLLVFVLIPPLIYLRHYYPKRGGRLMVPFVLWDGAPFSSPATFRGIGMRLSAFMYWSAWILLVIALAGPTETTRERVFLSRGSDIMIVLDESASMAAQDFRPSTRFETARKVIRRFVRQRGNDHIGLVGFSAEAALRVPPTTNGTYLVESLDAVRLMELGDGTSIGMGLALATLHLRSSGAENRVIILLTDGVNNAGEISPEAAAEVAGDLGIRIYAIGVGSGEEAEIEVQNPETGELIRGTVRDGYDGETLQRVADLSGGTYFSATGAGTLEAIFDAIDTAETVERRVRIEVRRRPVHRNFLIVALALLVAELLLRRIIVGVSP